MNTGFLCNSKSAMKLCLPLVYVTHHRCDRAVEGEYPDPFVPAAQLFQSFQSLAEQRLGPAIPPLLHESYPDSAGGQGQEFRVAKLLRYR